MSRRIRVLALWAVAAAALALAWRLTWFLCDDAFIEFRYASNSRFGLGYVWNPPPFRPVEGYTSFAWVALLDGVWRSTGIEPPRAANTLALLAAMGTLAVVLWLMARVELSPSLARVRWPLAALVLAGTVGNRTFIAWSSSGLEASLFALAFGAWLVACVTTRERSPRRLALIATLATLSALIRPDGLVAVAATGVLLARDARRPRGWLAALPLLAVVAHTVWRRAFYGAWLPNTWAAKQVSPWPACGARYLASFVLEYGLLPWLVVVGLALRRARRPPLPQALAAAAWTVHGAYYTFYIGGDHFEYRAYLHWVPFLFVAFVVALDRLRVSARSALAATAAFVLFTLPVQWLQFAHDWPTRLRSDEDPPLRIASHLPPGTQWYGRAYDALQVWLKAHGACLRYADHRDFWLRRLGQLPPRTVGERIGPEGLPVRVGYAVGYLGWVLPHVAVIDRFGLTDRVVARTPSTQPRYLAHDREPPPGYLDCFDPNVELAPTRIDVRPREQPLTPERVRACEAKFDR